MPDPTSARDVPFTARALGRVAVFDRPGGTIVGQIAPDSVYEARASGDWLRIEHGYVARTDMQPIARYVPPLIERDVQTPFWAEVIAPSSVLRAWCSGRATVVSTLGYGAVVPVIGALTDDRGAVWYEIAPEIWGIADHFARVDVSPLNADSPRLTIDPHAQTIRILDGRLTLLTAEYFGGAVLFAKAFSQPLTTSLQVIAPGAPSGIPWQMRLGDAFPVYGAFWHNRFGLPSDEADLHLPIAAAKLLYRLAVGRTLTVAVE